MKICMQQYFGSNHSWAIVGQNIARQLVKKGHQVDIFSTNGIDLYPEDLKPNLIGYVDGANILGKSPGNDYDCSISYTCLKNMQSYLSHSKTNRFGIWCYEFAGKNALPNGFAKYHKFADKLLPPSNFAKQVFLDSGIPESAMQVIPHGIDFEELERATSYQLKTRKSTKIAIVLGQIHRRKNLAGMLDMYGKAFTKKDDVCLVLKIQDRAPKQPFELSFKDIFDEFKFKYRDHAEVEVITEFIPNMFSIYKACEIVLSATFCEGFGCVPLEANALGLINVSSKYGGQLDFLNDDNSLLIEGKEFSVPPNHLYWQLKHGTKAFTPNIDEGAEKLRYAVQNKEMLLDKYKQNIELTKQNYNWSTITDQILNLCV